MKLLKIITICLILTSCGKNSNEFEIRYRIDQESKCVDNKITITTQLVIWKKYKWFGTVIYDSNKETSMDSLMIVSSKEKEYSYNYFTQWLNINQITDTIKIKEDE